MVTPQQRIASAFAVFCGRYGDVSRCARERGVSRQWLYRDAQGVCRTLQGHAQRELIAQLQTQVRQLTQQLQTLQQQLDSAVLLDDHKQAEFACVAQARGVSLPDCRELLEVLLPGRALSVASLGRRTHAAAVQAGQLLAVLDDWTKAQVREAAADEIYVKDPVLMIVELESLCWVQGRLSDTVSGEAWAQQFEQLPNLELLTRDGGSGLTKGVALLNAARQREDQPVVVDQGDHFHALRGGSVGLRKAQAQASQALAAAEAAEKELAAVRRQGHKETGAVARVRAAWRKAEAAVDRWSEQERAWQTTKEALQLFTPQGELNTSQHAAAVLAQTLPQLPDSAFAKTKQQLQKPEMLRYLDRVQQQIEALPFAAELKEAALRQEGLRRRPETLQGEGAQAVAAWGVLLACGVVLGQAGAVGKQAAAAVHDIVRRAYRASSLVECINSVLRMQQARHRKMTQGLLDLKRLYWNCHTFRTGRRRGTTPYQRLGVPWPEGLRWWDLLKLSPEQLRDKLSTTPKAA
jgi:hypothetical protein